MANTEHESSSSMAPEVHSTDWSVGIVELPNGRRMAYYNGTTNDREAAEAEILREYEAAGALAAMAEDIASSLGFTAKSLLEMSITRVETPEKTTDLTKE